MRSMHAPIRGSLEIEQQAKFIESLRGESLGFIKNKHREIPGGMTLKKPSMQSIYKVALGLRLTRHAEIAQDESKQPDWFKVSMENVGTGEISLAKPVQDLV